MRDHVTVIPVDRIIMVDNEPLWFDFSAPEALHALQWHDGAGHMEFTDGRMNAPLTLDDYHERVAPFVVLWETEKARLKEEASRPPDPPTLEEARAAKLAELMRGYETAFAPIGRIYPATEREGWAVQEVEAKAVLADPDAETPVLSLLAQMRGLGETVAELAAKVLENAATWRSVYALITGQQQRMYWEIMELQTVESILAYDITFQLSEGV